MTSPSLFASFRAEPDRRTAAASEAAAPSQPLPREQAERLAHLFRLSIRAGQVHPLAHLLEVHRARSTTP